MKSAYGATSKRPEIMPKARPMSSMLKKETPMMLDSDKKDDN